MENFSDRINWDNIFAQSDAFRKNTPCKFGFIEELFQRDFYEKLYESYPKIDETWNHTTAIGKESFSLYFEGYGKNKVVGDEDDPALSQEWNDLKRYARSKEFVENFRKFSGVPVNKLKYFHFIAMKKGGFQLPHVHNVGPSTLVFMIYFSKNWKNGDPGGTYISAEDDESSIIFEPYNLDNSVAIFHDGPNAMHGARYIKKDVERHALQITLEQYDEKLGWSGGNEV